MLSTFCMSENYHNKIWRKKQVRLFLCQNPPIICISLRIKNKVFTSINQTVKFSSILPLWSLLPPGCHPFLQNTQACFLSLKYSGTFPPLGLVYLQIPRPETLFCRLHSLSLHLLSVFIEISLFPTTPFQMTSHPPSCIPLFHFSHRIYHYLIYY